MVDACAGSPSGQSAGNDELDGFIQQCNTSCHIAAPMVSSAVRQMLCSDFGPGMALFADENGTSSNNSNSNSAGGTASDSFPLACKLQSFMLPNIDEYLELFDQRFMFRQCRTATWATTVVYLLRLTQVPGFRITGENVHMCALGCVSLAVKWLIDASPHSAYFASAGGITLAHHKSVERVVLKLLNYRLFVHPEPFATALLLLLQAGQTQVPLTTLHTARFSAPATQQPPQQQLQQQKPLVVAATASTEANNISTTSRGRGDRVLSRSRSQLLPSTAASAAPQKIFERERRQQRPPSDESAPGSGQCCCVSIPRGLHTLFAAFCPEDTSSRSSSSRAAKPTVTVTASVTTHCNDCTRFA